MSTTVYILGEKSPEGDIWTAGKLVHITTDREWQLLKYLVQSGADNLESERSDVKSLLTNLEIA